MMYVSELSGKAAEILLHQLKVMPDLLLMLRQFSDNPVACTVCMNVMWSLCATGKAIRPLTRAQKTTPEVGAVTSTPYSGASFSCTTSNVVNCLRGPNFRKAVNDVRSHASSRKTWR